MNNKIYTLVGAALLLVFGGFAFSAFQDSLTPYVPYEKARRSPGTVQVAGELQKGTSAYDGESRSLLFTLVESEGHQDTLRVRYHGLKPANFEDALSIVAIGSWDTEAQEFAADKLLVKCPSKYQGVEKVETKEYG